MKTLYLVRHAKSSWDSGAVRDFDRPLTDRGKKNASDMAERLARQKIEIGLFISSPAKRAKATAELFVKGLGRNKHEIRYLPELYQADKAVYYHILSGLDNDHETAALFSHNPGITEFANSLTETSLDDMPTCSVFGIVAKTDSWQTFQASEKKFLFFDYPKSKVTD